MIQRILFVQIIFILVFTALVFTETETSESTKTASKDKRMVFLKGRSLHDSEGPFLGLGVTYMSAMYQCKHDKSGLLNDLAVLKKNGFNYIRILSMVSWDGLEIPPCPFKNKNGKNVEQWPDYDQILAELIDTTYDTFGLRMELTIFADAQIVMPDENQRYQHIDRIVKILKGREHKIIMLEIANEAWQNGFPEKEGVKQMREMCVYLKKRTEIPVALSAPYSIEQNLIQELYADSGADIATLHFSRDTRKENGWYPVRECWDCVKMIDIPISSNEPIGPGASVASEDDPAKLVGAALFAWVSGLPMYVYHTSAGVYGKDRFEDAAGITDFGSLLSIMPPDIPNWNRFDAALPGSPFKLHVKRTASGTNSNMEDSPKGCLYCPGASKEDRFILIPMGVYDQGMEIHFLDAFNVKALNPSTGNVVLETPVKKEGSVTLPKGFGVYIIYCTRL